MACAITAGISKSCGYKVGGLNQLWLANYAEISGITSSATTFITTGNTWYEFEFEKNTGSFVSELVVNNGQKSINHSVSFSLTDKSQASLTQLDNISLGKFVSTCKDKNAVKYILGRINGLEATIASIGSGANETDSSLIQVTLAGLQTEHAFVYTGSN